MDGGAAFRPAGSPRTPRTSPLRPPSVSRSGGPLAAAQERSLGVSERRALNKTAN
jgi:hypothetical protein